jgi:membrane-bound lytic murein transglycosylase MltF
MNSVVRLLLVTGILAGCAYATDVAILQNGFSIRHEHREIMGSSTRLYLDNGTSSYVDVPTTEIDHFEQDFSPKTTSAKPLPSVINEISSRHHLDPDLVNSVIHAESGFNPKAVSRKGAQGLMQLMPGTASRLGVDDAFDPGANVEGGTRYLRALLERYNFDLVKALAAYNAGPLRVEHYGGVPPYSETQAYVARIVRDFNRKKLAERAAARQTATHRHATHPSANIKQASLPASSQIAQR